MALLRYRFRATTTPSSKEATEEFPQRYQDILPAYFYPYWPNSSTSPPSNKGASGLPPLVLDFPLGRIGHMRISAVFEKNSPPDWSGNRGEH